MPGFNIQALRVYFKAEEKCFRFYGHTGNIEDYCSLAGIIKNNIGVIQSVLGFNIQALRL